MDRNGRAAFKPKESSVRYRPFTNILCCLLITKITIQIEPVPRRADRKGMDEKKLNIYIFPLVISGLWLLPVKMKEKLKIKYQNFAMSEVQVLH